MSQSYQPNSSFIAYYSTTHTPEAVYIIGGRYTTNIVAKYKDNNWSKLTNNLNKGREGHNSITIGTQTMIIGGVTDRE